MTDPENFEHTLSVIIFLLRDRERNWPLWISNRNFLNLLLYWSPGTIMSLSLMYQVNQLVLIYGSVPDQVTIKLQYYLYNPPQSWLSTLTLGPSNTSDHLIMATIFGNITLWSLVAYYFYLLSRTFYMCILLFILPRYEPTTKLNISWRQSRFQFLIKLPLILKLTFRQG